MIKVLTGIFLLLNLAAMGEENPWTQVRDRNGVRVYNRSIEGIDFKEFMGEVEIDAEPEMIMAIFNDVELSTEWIENIDLMEEIQRKGPYENYTYSYTKAPWPVRDRDAVVNSVRIERPEEGIIEVIQKAAPDKVPYNDNVQRVERLSSSWIFTLQEDGLVHVRYQVLTDPGGKIPAWLVNRVSVSQPYNTLLGLKELAEGVD